MKAASIETAPSHQPVAYLAALCASGYNPENRDRDCSIYETSPQIPHPREPQTWLALSWDRAQTAARRWVDSLNIATRSLKGQTVDLTPQAPALAKLYPEPKFRTMVIRAAVRLLRTRGVEATIPEPNPPSTSNEN